MSALSTFFKESDTQLGIFYPKHYLIAAFRNLDSAQKAGQGLRYAGFPPDEVIAVEGAEIIQLAKEETQKSGLWSILMHELSRFIATEEIYTDHDLVLARRGAGFVAVHCPTEGTKRQAWNVLQPEAPLAARYYANDGIDHLAGDLTTN